MKRVILLLLLTLISVISSHAQVGYFKNNSTTRIVLRLQQGTCQKRDNGSYIFIPIPPSKPGVPKTPDFTHTIGATINSLYTFGQFGGYTLYIIRSEEIICKVDIPQTDKEIPIPEPLIGNSLLFFVDENNGDCYYGEIFSGTFSDIDPKILPTRIISEPYTIEKSFLLYKHLKVTDGGILIIKGEVTFHPSVTLAIEGSGQVIVDGGTLNNVHLIMKGNAYLSVRNRGSVIFNKDYPFSTPYGIYLEVRPGSTLVYK